MDRAVTWTDAIKLPELRPDLALLEGTRERDGRPGWLIFDPVKNTFTRIDPAAYEALKHWPGCATSDDLIAAVHLAGQARLDRDGVAGLVDFLNRNELTIASKPEGWRGFVKVRALQRRSLIAWLIHNYLFIRIPLVQPQEALVRTLPFMRAFWGKWAIGGYCVMGGAGLYLASRMWEHFVGSLTAYLTWEGAATAAIALAAIKGAHELGHAYAAVSVGCRVHSMGLAFVVMAPMPYTDVTDAWRLTDRRKRLLIDSAGVLTELAIAATALFFWAFLPDGGLRSTAFVLCAVSLISSLAINLNPFMRFDGYYLLSELTGVENLQARSFSLARWKMREFLFGVKAPCPELMPGRLIALLVVYAWLTWIYRLLLFLGIALIVYVFFFKVLGIVLFAVEIVFFIVRPIAGELFHWWKMRNAIASSRRGAVSLSLSAAGLFACFLPWSTTIEIPSILEAGELRTIHAVRNAEVAGIHVAHGQPVKAGDPIATLSSSDIEDEVLRTHVSLQIAERQFARRGVDAIDRERSIVLESQIETMRAKLAGLDAERSELKISAPFDGTIVDLNAELHPARWVGTRDQIVIVAGAQGLAAKGYATEADAERIIVGAEGVFVPEHPSRPRVAVRIDRIATAGAGQIDLADLASTNSGRIAVNVDERRRLVPAAAQFLVTMSAIEGPSDLDLAVRGVVHAKARPESLASRALRRALSVLVRESGV